MSKQITVIPATGGAYRDITIEPGTTARDIKKALNLSNENVLTKGRGAEPIPESENLYETLLDGAKLYSTTAVEWGGPFLDWLDYLLTPSKPRIQIRRTYTPPGNQTHTVPRHPIPYWREQGWARDGQSYTGEFQTAFGRWPGWITESPGGRVDTHIGNPPAALKRHSHWPCFRKRDNGWFFIHPIKDVPDVSAAILAVEKTLTEALTRN